MKRSEIVADAPYFEDARGLYFITNNPPGVVWYDTLDEMVDDTGCDTMVKCISLLED